MKKLNWGIIGGGAHSQIGLTHRVAAGLDGVFQLSAGAFDIDPEAGRKFGLSLGLEPERVYSDWRQMLQAERQRHDKLDLVTIATPNATHHEITKAWLEAGFNVLCEKPLTMTLTEARDIVACARRQGKICAVNYGYSGYALVRQARAMVASGELGEVRLIVAEFAHGHHADAADADNPRVRWRYDPEQAGVSSVFADCGIHALHLASYVSGQQPAQLSADFCSCVAGRALEDDAMLNVRLDGGATLRLWSSAVALGRQHGLTIQVFASKGGLRWSQEQPNQLYWTPLHGNSQIIERSAPKLSSAATAAARVAIGHAEGFFGAFANIYSDIASALVNGDEANYPDAYSGLVGIAAIEAAARSASQGGAWTDIDLNLN